MTSAIYLQKNLTASLPNLLKRLLREETFASNESFLIDTRVPKDFGTIKTNPSGLAPTIKLTETKEKKVQFLESILDTAARLEETAIELQKNGMEGGEVFNVAKAIFGRLEVQIELLKFKREANEQAEEIQKLQREQIALAFRFVDLPERNPLRNNTLFLTRI